MLELGGPWAGRRLDENAITLDFARASTDGGANFAPAEPVLGIHERFTATQFSGPLKLAFDVRIDQPPRRCGLVLEQPEMYGAVTVNDRPVSFTGGEFYRDKSFRRTDVTGLLRPGLNTIVLALDYVAPAPASLDARQRYGSEIESIYLVGDFGVAAETSARKPAATQRNNSRVLPRRPIHRFRRFALTAEQDSFDGDLADKGYPFFAGAFECAAPSTARPSSRANGTS